MNKNKNKQTKQNTHKSLGGNNPTLGGQWLKLVYVYI